MIIHLLIFLRFRLNTIFPAEFFPLSLVPCSLRFDKRTSTILSYTRSRYVFQLFARSELVHRVDAKSDGSYIWFIYFDFIYFSYDCPLIPLAESDDFSASPSRRKFREDSFVSLSIGFEDFWISKWGRIVDIVCQLSAFRYFEIATWAMARCWDTYTDRSFR